MKYLEFGNIVGLQYWIVYIWCLKSIYKPHLYSIQMMKFAFIQIFCLVNMTNYRNTHYTFWEIPYI